MIFQGCTCLRSALPLARARSAPTEQAVHQFKGVHLSQVHRPSKKRTNSRGCTCLKCTDHEVHRPSTWMPPALLVQLRQLHPLKNAVCFVGAAETAAPPDVCSKSVIRVSSACSVEADFCALKISQKKLWNPPPNPMQILYKWVQRKSSL